MIPSKKYRLQKYSIFLRNIQYLFSRSTVTTLFTRWNALVNLKGKKEQSSLANGRGKKVMSYACGMDGLGVYEMCQLIKEKYFNLKQVLITTFITI
jgi:hypothetical protein